MRSLILVVRRQLFKLQRKKSGRQGPGVGLSPRAVTSNAIALGKLQPEPVGHDHGSCAEKVGIMRGLVLSGSNFQSEVVSSCVMSFPVTTGKKLLLQNLPPPRLPALEGE